MRYIDDITIYVGLILISGKIGKIKYIGYSKKEAIKEYNKKARNI